MQNDGVGLRYKCDQELCKTSASFSHNISIVTQFFRFSVLSSREAYGSGRASLPRSQNLKCNPAEVVT